jgi:hypothetical protein
MISIRHQFLFVHIPKTAGNSIQGVLRDYSEDTICSAGPGQDGVERFGVWNETYRLPKHATLAQYRRALGEELFRSLFKFCCVRNPWDRAISFYFSPHRGPVSWDRQAFLASVSRLKPCAAYVALDDGKASAKSPFENVDFVLRFEQLDEDFRQVCRRIGIPFQPLAVRNRSRREPFTRYFDAELIELVSQRFRDDVDTLGYRFPSDG